MMKRFCYLLAYAFIISGAAASALHAQDTPPPVAIGLAPPTEVTVKDRPNDVGTALIITWTLSTDDVEQTPRRVTLYQVKRSTDIAGPFVNVADVPYGTNTATDQSCERGKPYYYQVIAVGPADAQSIPATSLSAVAARMQFFDMGKAWFGLLLLIVCGAVIYFITVAKSGRSLKLRKIAGLEAVDEAVGRATEMGRPLLFIPGIQDINDIQTVAGISVLGRVAKTAAEYDAPIEVPTARSLVMTTCRETVQSAFLTAGRPDAFNADKIYYVTDEQFGYVAYVTGHMVRTKPAACFYFGKFYAESLILAETGNSIGAIQIAGTAEPAQLPFFVAACDYTLIGEEFFAASAYLSNEPSQLGSIKGQDVGKLIFVAIALVGCIVATAAEVSSPGSTVHAALDFIKNTMLGT